MNNSTMTVTTTAATSYNMTETPSNRHVSITNDEILVEAEAVEDEEQEEEVKVYAEATPDPWCRRNQW